MSAGARVFASVPVDRSLPVPFPLVALVGPTAVGKTELSLRLAEELNGEIVNVDSVQIYRGLDIGTAKPTPEERARVPHHLIDVVDPDEPFDAAEFARRASRLIRAIVSRGRVPLLVGGTGLYLRALLEGMAPSHGEDPAVRATLRALLERKGPEALHGWLGDVDPEAARRLHPHDVFRVIRALEVYAVSGRPISDWQAEQRRSRAPEAWPCVRVCLGRGREELYQRIDRRVDLMLSEGFLDEVRGLLARGYAPGLKPLQSLGYRHMIEFLGGEIPYEEAVRQLKRDTRRYAKRQLTWFRAECAGRWFHPETLMRARRIWPVIVTGGRFEYS